MTKPAIKVENGIVSVSINQTGDFNNDGQPSVKASLSVEIMAYELITEIAKKDLPMLELIIAQIKSGV